MITLGLDRRSPRSRCLLVGTLLLFALGKSSIAQNPGGNEEAESFDPPPAIWLSTPIANISNGELFADTISKDGAHNPDRRSNSLYQVGKYHPEDGGYTRVFFTGLRKRWDFSKPLDWDSQRHDQWGNPVWPYWDGRYVEAFIPKPPFKIKGGFGYVEKEAGIYGQVWMKKDEIEYTTRQEYECFDETPIKRWTGHFLLRHEPTCEQSMEVGAKSAVHLAANLRNSDGHILGHSISVNFEHSTLFSSVPAWGLVHPTHKFRLRLRTANGTSTVREGRIEFKKENGVATKIWLSDLPNEPIVADPQTGDFFVPALTVGPGVLHLHTWGGVVREGRGPWQLYGPRDEKENRDFGHLTVSHHLVTNK